MYQIKNKYITSNLTVSKSIEIANNKKIKNLKYKYKDLTEGERRTIVYEGTHTQIKNVLISDYPNVKVEEE